MQTTTAREMPTSIDLHRAWPITANHIIRTCLSLHSIEKYVAGEGPNIVCQIRSPTHWVRNFGVFNIVVLPPVVLSFVYKASHSQLSKFSSDKIHILSKPLIISASFSRKLIVRFSLKLCSLISNPQKLLY